MKTTSLVRAFKTGALAAFVAVASLQADQAATTAVMRKVFDWQVAHPTSARYAVTDSKGNRGWVQGAFLTGAMEASRATGDAAYVDYARRTAEANGWQLGPRPEHADDYIVGQTYLELNALASAPGQIDDTKKRLDELVARPIAGRELWWWCDALYMCPPTLAKLAQATGDKKYLEALDRWYWDAYAYLYDPEGALFYRDKRYLFPKEGQKVFWSRGNGWVIAGLARLLDALPADYPLRPKYIALYQAMAAKLVAVQPADGLWRANLLNEAGAHGEGSGSAFFCYALAWGVNRGVLPAEKYRPVVDRTWAALLACVDAEGRFGWVQPIGFAPDHYDAATYQEYGAGAFLAAGSQVMQLK
ncbi:MAG: glycoside hydrolase family 88 protein [Lacunisphaera sp.]